VLQIFTGKTPFQLSPMTSKRTITIFDIKELLLLSYTNTHVVG